MQADPSPDRPGSAAVILFDGVCNLCNAWVRFVLPRDRGRFRFGALQSNAARALLDEHGRDPDALESILLIENGRVHERSDAVLRILAGLGRAWPLLRVFAVVPRPIRDAVYDRVARGRYRWFGRRDACMLPSPDWRDRFIGD